MAGIVREITGRVLSKSYSIEDRAKYEGLYQLNAFGNVPTYSFNTLAADSFNPQTNGAVFGVGSFFFSIKVNLAKQYFVKSAYAWASDDLACTWNIGSKQIPFVAGRNQLEHTFEDILFSKEILSGVANGLISPTAPTTGNKFLMRGGVIAYTMSADIDYSAPYSIVILGDSNDEGSAILNPTSSIVSSNLTSNDLWSWQVRNWYRNRGYRVRLIDKSLASQGSVYFENLRQRGQLRLLDAPDLIVYKLGTNDGNATTLATNASNFIDWALAEWPADIRSFYSGVKIVVMGQIPYQGNETQANLNRTALQTVVSSKNNNRVKYINGGDAFSVNDNTQFSNVETVGSQIHLSKIGQQSLANYFITQMGVIDSSSTVKFSSF